jgi:hypothetical protein
MATLPESSVFESLFQSALEKYEKVTGIDLVRHPLAAQLERCNSVESMTQVLQDRAEAFCKFRGGNHEAIAVLKHTVRALHTLSAIDLVCPRSSVDSEIAASDVSSQPVPGVGVISTCIGALLDVCISIVTIGDML